MIELAWPLVVLGWGTVAYLLLRWPTKDKYIGSLKAHIADQKQKISDLMLALEGKEGIAKEIVDATNRKAEAFEQLAAAAENTNALFGPTFPRRWATACKDKDGCYLLRMSTQERRRAGIVTEGIDNH